MTYSQPNELKYRVLKAVEELDGGTGVTSGELAEELGKKQENISKQLLRYNRQGLLSREKEDLKNVRDGRVYRNRRYRYDLTRKGRKRKDYLFDNLDL